MDLHLSLDGAGGGDERGGGGGQQEGGGSSVVGLDNAGEDDNKGGAAGEAPVAQRGGGQEGDEEKENESLRVAASSKKRPRCDYENDDSVNVNEPREGTERTQDKDAALEEEDVETKRSNAVRKLADLLIRFLQDPGDDTHRGEVLQFFQDQRNVQDFSQPGDILWRGGEHCAALRRLNPGPLHPYDPDLGGAVRRHFRRRRLSAPLRPVRSFIEGLLEISNYNLPVRDLLTEIVQTCPHILRHTPSSFPPAAESGGPPLDRSNGTTRDGTPPTLLHAAVQRAQPAAAAASVDMIRLFAHPDLAVVKDPSMGRTPLHWAACHPSSDAAWFLLGLNPNAASIADAAGMLPIHHYLTLGNRQDDFSWPVLDRFVKACPESLSRPHPVSRLEPAIAILRRLELRSTATISHRRFRGGDAATDDDPHGAVRIVTEADAAARIAARILREHKPAVLQDATSHLSRRPSRSKFDTPLIYWCRDKLHVDLLNPLIELCPVALVASFREWEDLAERRRIVRRMFERIRMDREWERRLAEAHRVFNGGGGGGRGRNDNNIIVRERAGNGDGGSDDDDEGRWHDRGTPLEWVRKRPHPVAPGAVDRSLTIATSDMFLALLEALLASPLCGEVAVRIAAHFPSFVVAHHPLMSLVETGAGTISDTGANDAGTAADAVRTDVIHLPSVQELLFESATFRDCATGLYRMNRHPDARRFFVSGPVDARISTAGSGAASSAQVDLFRALEALQECSNGNLDCVYIKLRSRPGVLGTLRGSSPPSPPLRSSPLPSW